ncbi:DUF1634 domain-containing protein [Weissella koreensis]|uniref:DUF1634 domain-containing protein n=1 Tax=Weissella koreensis TaxID=165096 RepID=UPI0002174594|nr:DUF1634 domain-containing protein [Weissella koreensis]AEJ23133.1 hypothetical protein WKK_01285 [Weissella koreensis KACC 15510]MCZ9310574.1 DUF1634 domain-containing protein [Weissella koreensis]
MKDEMSRLELIIGKILRVGVAISIGLMLFGCLLLVFRNNKEIIPYYSYLELNKILSGILVLQPNAWLMGGLFVLILTPVIRVLTSVFAFMKVKDWTYMWITSLVLLILIVAMIFGISQK